MNKPNKISYNAQRNTARLSDFKDMIIVAEGGKMPKHVCETCKHHLSEHVATLTTPEFCNVEGCQCEKYENIEEDL